MKSKAQKALLFALIASVLWALVNPLIKFGLGSGMPPLNFAGLRFFCSGVILLLYTAHKGMWREVWENRGLFAALVFANMLLGYATFYYGVAMTPAAISSIVVGTTPLVNVLLAHFAARNDRLDARKAISIAVSMAGVVLIVGNGGEGGGLMSGAGIVGVSLLFASIISQGLCAIKVSEYQKSVDPVFMNGVQMLLGGASLYIAGVATEGFYPLAGLGGSFYAAFAGLVVISVFAFSFWFTALRLPGGKVSELNMCRLVNPVLGATLSWIMIPGEHPTLSTVAGMVIIVGSLLFYFGRKQA